MTARELSMCLDVKVDTKERRSEFLNLKNWTRFWVKIEAIPCFPCYVKVTLFQSGHETDSNSIVRITLPGLNIQKAYSRSKDFTYGFFWKCNRKRCSIFLAFESDAARAQHMTWVKDAIQMLERYRQEFLEIRRASRCSTEIVDKTTDPFSNYQNLGPLPPLPDVTTEMDDSFKRQSTVSGIYEEIPDMLHRSGIYEEMKQSSCQCKTDVSQTPPPLPPRRRINTLDKGDHDQDVVKRRKYKSVLDSIFGITYRRGHRLSEGDEDEVDAKLKHEMFLLESHPSSNLIRNKRNSFSTPELASIDHLEDLPKHDEAEEDEGWQDISCMSLISDSVDVTQELNISQRIKPNFNLSGNSSVINLVGCNFNAVRESEMGAVRKSINEVSGYCVMKPIANRARESEEQKKEQYSGYCPMGQTGFDIAKVNEMDHSNGSNDDVDLISNITFGRGSDPNCDVSVFLTPKRNDIYENVPEKRHSGKYLIDDKIPSYFPNSPSPPRLAPKQKSRNGTPPPSVQSYCPRAVPNIYSVPRNNSPVLMDNAKDTEKLKQSLTDTISKLSISTNESPKSNNISIESTRATPEKSNLTKISSPNSNSKYLDKCSLKADFANLKRFASLPRFRKLDLSPLKIKLSSVLQRHNSEF